MDLWSAVILGIVEGITEFLPISSTGHLILAAKLLGCPQTEFLKSFEIVIQLGAIMAVIFLYGKSLILNVEILKRVACAFIPTAIVGFIFYKVIKHFLGNAELVVWSLLLGGVFLIVFELVHRENEHNVKEIARIPYTTAALIGVFQAMAMVPGVSRAAATIIGGLILGVQRKTIVEFSFLLAVPTMLAAAVLDILKSPQPFSSGEWGVLAVGFFTAFGVAIASIKFLLYFIKNHSFIIFGVYRILAAVAFWVFVLR